jgi:competence protein ComEA
MRLAEDPESDKASGSRVADAVERAGGLTRRADPAGVNLAAPVADGEQVVVPARLPAAVAAAQGAPVDGAGGSAVAGPVQLSVATAEQRDSLPGIGPVTTELSLSRTDFSSDSTLDQGSGCKLGAPGTP